MNEPDVVSPLPFEGYRSAGRAMLGVPRQGDVTARHGYGPPVFQECGFSCAYCGYDMSASYEAWLQISVDHVIPRSALGAGYPRAWIEDLANLVTCCRSCNEFTNSYSMTDPVPASEAGFFEIRDRHFIAKRVLARAAQERERAWHSANGLARTETVPLLMARYGALLRELRTRGVTRTDNNPVSDYAEELVARALHLERGTGSTRGYDGIDAAGIRYQVKARRLSPVYNNRQLGTIRNLDQDLFDVLVGVLFEEDFAVRRAAAIPISVVRTRARAVGYVNGASLYLTDDLWQEAGVTDLTIELREVAAAWTTSEPIQTVIVRSEDGKTANKSAPGRKYGPLTDHLRSLARPAHVSFDEIDRLVGGLPKSAYTYREWWANHARNPQAAAWLKAGRQVDDVDLVGHTVRFT